jgi:hypothetical protein
VGWEGLFFYELRNRPKGSTQYLFVFSRSRTRDETKKFTLNLSSFPSSLTVLLPSQPYLRIVLSEQEHIKLRASCRLVTFSSDSELDLLRTRTIWLKVSVCDGIQVGKEKTDYIELVGLIRIRNSSQENVSSHYKSPILNPKRHQFHTVDL